MPLSDFQILRHIQHIKKSDNMKIVSQHKEHEAAKVIYSSATLPVGQKHPYHYCSCLLTLRLSGMEEESISDHK